MLELLPGIGLRNGVALKSRAVSAARKHLLFTLLAFPRPSLMFP
jgi:hypothetical protein